MTIIVLPIIIRRDSRAKNAAGHLLRRASTTKLGNLLCGMIFPLSAGERFPFLPLCPVFEALLLRP